MTLADSHSRIGDRSPPMNEIKAGYLNAFPNKSGEILSADPRWKTNADLIWAVAAIGWIPDNSETLDLTYGLGRFWNRWRPERLTSNDLNPKRGADHQYDYNQLPQEWAGRFAAVFYDPSYKLSGDTLKYKLTDNADYGVGGDGKGWVQARQTVVTSGLASAAAVCQQDGWVHAKCQNQTAGFKYQNQAGTVMNEGARLGLRPVAVWQFCNPSPRPQPATRPNGSVHIQKTPRNNASQLISFKKL